MLVFLYFMVVAMGMFIGFFIITTFFIVERTYFYLFGKNWEGSSYKSSIENWIIIVKNYTKRKTV